MKRWIIPSLVAGLSLTLTAAHAHHSISGVYDTNRQITVEGVVTEFHFINPHPFLTMDVKQGAVGQQWRLEMDNRSELAEVGVTRDTFKAGDRVVVSGNPASAQAQNLYIRRLDRQADGFRYEQVGTSPRINFKPR